MRRMSIRELSGIKEPIQTNKTRRQPSRTVNPKPIIRKGLPPGDLVLKADIFTIHNDNRIEPTGGHRPVTFAGKLNDLQEQVNKANLDPHLRLQANVAIRTAHASASDLGKQFHMGVAQGVLHGWNVSGAGGQIVGNAPGLSNLREHIGKLPQVPNTPFVENPLHANVMGIHHGMHMVHLHIQDKIRAGITRPGQA